MKKLIAFILTLALLGTLLVSFSGCGLFSPKVENGTEAAKLLLAGERLDENLVGAKLDLGFSSGVPTDPTATLVLIDRVAPFAALYGNGFTAPLRTTGNGTAYTWAASEFPATSSSATEFSQFIKTVEEEAARVAEDIAHMKTSVGVTDKWVNVGYERQMLRVYENRDVLIVLGEYGDVHVYIRYTNENAKNVYEMYSLMKYDNGHTGNIRTMFVPGERYEYMFEHSDGFNDYFIAENTRGYWMSTRFGYTEWEEGGEGVSFYPYIVKDGLGYGAALSMDTRIFSDEVIAAEKESGTPPSAPTLKNEFFSLFDPVNEREFFRIRENSTDIGIALWLSAVRSGLVSVSATEWNDRDGKPSTGMLDTFVTKNGTYTSVSHYPDIPEGEIVFHEGTVYYDYGKENYQGNIGFVHKGTDATVEEVTRKTFAHLADVGLSLFCNEESVLSALSHASLLADGFGEAFTWNGHKVTSFEEIAAARAVLAADYASARAEYEAVKDFPTAEEQKSLPRGLSFAKLEALVGDGNRFDGKKILLADVYATTDDVTLFEANEAYVLRIGLSLLDADGDPLGVNTVALAGGTSLPVTFVSDEITVHASGEYAIPTALDRGSYAVVAYIATADEGIRVSEIKKLAFVSIEEGEIASHEMAVTAHAEDGHLIVRYAISRVHAVTVKATKDSYTHAEITRLLTIEVLAYGTPYIGAVAEDASGAPLDEDGSFGRGTYLMVCYLPSENGLVQGYLSLTLE